MWTRCRAGTRSRRPFTAGTTGKVVLGDVSDSAKVVVADAGRLVKEATAVRTAGDEGSRWHSFSVRSTVQDWVNGTQVNHGFVLRATDEAALNMGGPRYEGSIFAYNGETASYPKLVVTYGRPGVEVDSPTRIHATGAALTWPSYVDPCGFCPADDIHDFSFAAPGNNPQVLGVFKRGGKEYVVWAQQAGHIYFDEIDDVRDQADGDEADHWDMELIAERAEEIVDADQVIDAGGGCSGIFCGGIISIPVPIPVPVGPAVPVP